jgi:hypothetical protein
MPEYTKMKKPELQALLKERGIPSSGNKDVLIDRLLDDDDLHAEPSTRQDDDNDGPLLDGVLEALQDQDPRDVTESLRELVHARNRKAAANTIKKQMKRHHHSGADQWGMLLKAQQLAAGKCLEPTCPSCGTGTLYESFDRLCGIASKCSDRTCKDPTNCSTCRRQIQELEDAFVQRTRENCIDGSCGDVFKCIPCEQHIQDAMLPDNPPEDIDETLDQTITGDIAGLRRLVTGLNAQLHNAYLRRLLRELQDNKPDARRWTSIKHNLEAGKCLAPTCSWCNVATISRSLEGLSHGRKTDCGNDELCIEFITCSSWRESAQAAEDILSRHDRGFCRSERCNDTYDCSRCRTLLDEVSIDSSFEDSEDDHPDDKEVFCVGGDCDGVTACRDCDYEREMEKDKRAERTCHDIRMRRFRRLGHCDKPDPDMPYGLGCRYIDCNRCRMIEAKIGPKMRNDELRRHRAEDITTSLNESSDGTMTGRSRKRRFSNLDLNYPLRPDHPLAKRVRDEQHREKQKRIQAQARHERPSWFGTPEDPLPDRWMGRPILSEKEIDILKVQDSIPKFYLSQSEEDTILFAKGTEVRKFCTIIRRLEAELMSRDFWMQSLGYEADDGFGHFPAGNYRLEEDQGNASSKKRKTTHVEGWLSGSRRPSTMFDNYASGLIQ